MKERMRFGTFKLSRLEKSRYWRALFESMNLYEPITSRADYGKERGKRINRREVSSLSSAVSRKCALKYGAMSDIKVSMNATTGDIETKAAITKAKQGQELRFIFKGEPGNLRFIECEDAAGRSVEVGLWRKGKGDTYELVLTSLPAPRG